MAEGKPAEAEQARHKNYQVTLPFFEKALTQEKLPKGSLTESQLLDHMQTHFSGFENEYSVKLSDTDKKDIEDALTTGFAKYFTDKELVSDKETPYAQCKAVYENTPSGFYGLRRFGNWLNPRNWFTGKKTAKNYGQWCCDTCSSFGQCAFGLTCNADHNWFWWPKPSLCVPMAPTTRWLVGHPFTSIFLGLYAVLQVYVLVAAALIIVGGTAGVAGVAVAGAAVIVGPLAMMIIVPIAAWTPFQVAFGAYLVTVLINTIAG